MDRGFQIIARKGAGQVRVLVFDREKRLHFPLTVFAAEAVKRSSRQHSTPLSQRCYSILRVAGEERVGWRGSELGRSA